MFFINNKSEQIITTNQKVKINIKKKHYVQWIKQLKYVIDKN